MKAKLYYIVVSSLYCNAQ